MSNEWSFTKEKEYKEEIEPLVQELVARCTANAMPIFVSVCTDNNENETKYKHSLVAPEVFNLELHNNMFTRFLSVTLGFETVYKKQETDFIPNRPTKTIISDLNDDDD